MSNTSNIFFREELFKKRTIFSFILSAILLIYFLSLVSLEDLVQHLKDANHGYILLAFLVHYATYLFRGERWKRMISHIGFRGSAIDLARIIFLFQSIDCILPSKLGDIYGAHLMKLNFSLSRSFSLGSIFLWRMLDFLVVVLVGVITAFLIFGSGLPNELHMPVKAAMLLICTIFLLIFFFVRFHKRLLMLIQSDRLRNLVDSFRHGLHLRWTLMPYLVLNTLIIWTLEVFRFYFICKSMGIDLDIVPVIFVTFFSALLTAVPLTPSGLGAVEIGMLKLLSLVGINAAVASPLIVWDRIIAHWSQILFGAVLIFFSRKLDLKIWEFAVENDTGSGKNLAVSKEM